MPPGVKSKRVSPPNGPINFNPRHHIFLRDHMSEHRRLPAVKKVKDPEIDSAATYPKLVYSIAKKIRLRSAQFMPKRARPFNRSHALSIGRIVRPPQFTKPFHNRNLPVGLTVEDDISLRHATFPVYSNIDITIFDSCHIIGRTDLLLYWRLSAFIRGQTA